MTTRTFDLLESAKSTSHWGTYGPSGKGPLDWKPLRDLSTDHLHAILETQPQVDLAFVNGYSYREIINSILDERKFKMNTRPKLVNGKIVMVPREPVEAKPAVHPYTGKRILVAGTRRDILGTDLGEYYMEIRVVSVHDDGACWKSKYSHYNAADYRFIEILGDIGD